MADQETNQTPEQADAAGAESAPESAVSRVSESAEAAGDALAEGLMASAEAAVGDAAGSGPEPVDLPDFGGPGAGNGAPAGLDLLADVSLNVKIELGRTRMFVEDVLRLNSGAVVELDKLAGDPVDIYVNDRRVARGEVLVVNDNFCVRVSEIIAAPGDEKDNRG